MSRRLLSVLAACSLIVFVAFSASGVIAQSPDQFVPNQIAATVGTGFTYQGQLKNASGPISGACDFEFSLWDSLASPTGQIGTTQTQTNVTVTTGLFTVQLDFGEVFNGDSRWLEIAVRCPAGSGSYTPLAPRQTLTPAPYALALPGLRTQQNVTSTNIIGGYNGNSVASGVAGATISGGGSADNGNSVTSDYGTVGGGVNNTASGYVATVGGGGHNTASGWAATISGGDSNTASKNYAMIPGGIGNTAAGSFSFAAGRGAAANHDGSFVWGDSTSAYITSTAANQFIIRANRGFAFVTSTVNFAPVINPDVFITTTTGASLSTSGVWTTNGVKFPDGTLQVTAATNTTYQNMIVVAKSGGAYTTISAALDNISDASDTNHYLVKVMPGSYTETVTMKEYVDIEGSGELTTKITNAGSANATTGTVIGASNAELRFLTVENTGGANYATAIYDSSASPHLTHLTVVASGGTQNYSVYNFASSPYMENMTCVALNDIVGTDVSNIGIYNDSSSPTMVDLVVTARGVGGMGANTNIGVSNNNSYPNMTNVTVNVWSWGYLQATVINNTGIANTSSLPSMINVTVAASNRGSGAGNGAVLNNTGMFNNFSSPKMTNVIVTASGTHPGVGGTVKNVGLSNTTSSSPTMTDVFITVEGGAYSEGVVDNTGLYNDSNSSPTIVSVSVVASGGRINTGIANGSSSSPKMINVNVTATGWQGTIENVGVANSSGSPLMMDVIATATSGGLYNIGVSNSSASVMMSNVFATATGSAGTYNTGVSNHSASPVMMNVIATALGGIDSRGLDNTASSPRIQNSAFSASNGASNYGLYNSAASGAYTITLNNSQITGLSNTIRNDSEFNVRVGASLLDGGLVSVNGGTVICAGVYDENYTFYTNTCP